MNFTLRQCIERATIDQRDRPGYAAVMEQAPFTGGRHALGAALPSGWIVRGQDPVSLDDESAPEPDIAVAPGPRAAYRHAHPARPGLIVEVAESSLRFDRSAKGSLYARAGIVDYWIVDLVDRVVEVYREPEPDATAPYGWRYLSLARFTPPDIIVPIVVPAAPIPVAALLP
jgi:Uma2 family endonuclease